MAKKLTGYWIYREYWKDDRLNKGEAFLMSIIWKFHKMPEGCHASNDYLAGENLVSPHSIENMISKLIKMGFLKIQFKTGLFPKSPSKRTRYLIPLIIPDDYNDDPDGDE